MKNIGVVLLIVGIAGLAYFGYEAMQQSESFEVLGADVAVSTANWTPVIVSGIVAIIGLILTVTKRGR
jgi:NO-binding membrane sensor protein with MHYT domain